MSSKPGGHSQAPAWLTELGLTAAHPASTVMETGGAYVTPSLVTDTVATVSVARDSLPTVNVHTTAPRLR